MTRRRARRSRAKPAEVLDEAERAFLELIAELAIELERRARSLSAAS